MSVITAHVREGRGMSHRGDVAGYRHFMQRFHAAHDAEVYAALRMPEPPYIQRVWKSMRSVAALALTRGSAPVKKSGLSLSSM